MDKPERTARTQYQTKVSEDFPDVLPFGETRFIKKFPMRYGENPGYPAAFYQEAGASGPNMASIELLQEGTKGLSYINVGDMDLGQRLARKLTEVFIGRKACVLIKHEMPSGVALGDDEVGTFEKAWKCDSLSNFGSVDVFNYPVTEPLARLLVESPRNVEVVYAPGFTPEALEVLATRKVLRVVRMGGSPRVRFGRQRARGQEGGRRSARPEAVRFEDHFRRVRGRRLCPEAERRRGPGRDLQLDRGGFHPFQRRRDRQSR